MIGLRKAVILFVACGYSGSYFSWVACNVVWCSKIQISSHNDDDIFIRNDMKSPFTKVHDKHYTAASKLIQHDTWPQHTTVPTHVLYAPAKILPTSESCPTLHSPGQHIIYTSEEETTDTSLVKTAMLAMLCVHKLSSPRDLLNCLNTISSVPQINIQQDAITLHGQQCVSALYTYQIVFSKYTVWYLHKKILS